MIRSNIHLSNLTDFFLILLIFLEKRKLSKGYKSFKPTPYNSTYKIKTKIKNK